MNNFSYPNYQQQPVMNAYGFNFSAAAPTMPAMNQLMTQDERKLLESQGAGLDIGRSEADMARAKCTHKTPEGLTIYQPDPVNDPTLWECTQCHEQFTIEDYSREEVADAVLKVLNIFNNIKLFIPKIAAEVGIPIYQAYAMLETMPRIYEYMLGYKNQMWRAVDAAPNPLQPNYGMNTMSMMNSLYNPSAPIYPGMYAQQQNPYGAPIAPQAPAPGMYAAPQTPAPGMYAAPQAPVCRGMRRTIRTESTSHHRVAVIGQRPVENNVVLQIQKVVTVSNL